MKKINSSFILISFAMIIASCGSKSSQVINVPQKDSISPKDTTLVSDNTKQEAKPSNYEGILPCSKCEGINTYISFSADYQSASVSMSHLDNPMVEAGYDYKMNTERGFEKDPDATVYILNYDKPVNEQWVFVRETGNDSTIFEIKSNRKRYSDKKNHTLVKKD